MPYPGGQRRNPKRITSPAAVAARIKLNTLRKRKKRKVKFHKKLTNEPFGKHAIIEDPDGHLISLAEMITKEELMQIPYYHGFAPE